MREVAIWQLAQDHLARHLCRPAAGGDGDGNGDIIPALSL